MAGSMIETFADCVAAIGMVTESHEEVRHILQCHRHRVPTELESLRIRTELRIQLACDELQVKMNTALQIQREIQCPRNVVPHVPGSNSAERVLSGSGRFKRPAFIEAQQGIREFSNHKRRNPPATQPDKPRTETNRRHAQSARPLVQQPRYSAQEGSTQQPRYLAQQVSNQQPRYLAQQVSNQQPRYFVQQVSNQQPRYLAHQARTQQARSQQGRTQQARTQQHRCLAQQVSTQQPIATGSRESCRYSSSGDLSDSCPICLENFRKNKSDVVTTTCNHIFCRKCIEQVPVSKDGILHCPLCRRGVGDVRPYFYRKV